MEVGLSKLVVKFLICAYDWDFEEKTYQKKFFFQIFYNFMLIFALTSHIRIVFQHPNIFFFGEKVSKKTEKIFNYRLMLII